MKPYAIIETGGKQYMVRAGDRLEVERLEQAEGETITLDKVFAFSDGTQARVGTPVVADVKVTAKVLRHLRGEKTVSFKKKRRKGYSRKKGHRQELTELQIESVS